MKNISGYRQYSTQYSTVQATVHFLYYPVSKGFTVSAFLVLSRIWRKKTQDEKTTVTKHVCIYKSIKLRIVVSGKSPLPPYLETVLSLSSRFSS